MPVAAQCGALSDILSGIRYVEHGSGRRKMKKTNATISRRELLKGSAAAGGLALLGSPRMSFAQAASASSTAANTKLAELEDLLRGEVILPGDSAYDSSRQVWNGMIDKHPSAIVRCSGAADVMDVVKFARDNRLPATVRGGGHNVAGKSVKDGAITIDLGNMNGVWVDPNAKRSRAQGGARWRDFDRETLALNLVTTGGTVSSTGIGGLTLGGGLGWLMRKHGLSCDNVVSADVVTADGRLLVVNDSENTDLFWAIRGGGGNFGVVTSFEYQLHDVEPVVGGMAMYPESMLKDLFHFFRDFTASAPDAVTAMAGVIIGPPGTPLEGQNACYIAACHSGNVTDGERLLRPIKEFGPPAMDFIGPTTYAAIQSMFDAGATATGSRNYWRSNFMAELSDGVIDAIVARSGELPPPASMILVEHLGGAVARVGENDTAFSNRDALYNVSVLGTWFDASKDPQNIAWVKTFGDELKAFSTGGAYINYMADESAGSVRAAYEANLNRLIEVKRKYDPTNFFSGNQNIVP
jgi:FAD/FMN-containing dehydrogenase